ncbi:MULTISPECIES: hypothetical protein [Xanthomonas]|uniref:Uncharacterized protein n=1 Tax=Xanthomonas dyei TaxID=743699 RepID=A0ABZ0D3F1_9XANT|nr:hypothetical protein [Xanthomonas dyei]WOB24742.1 hypothetical protein NYR99_13130 [Xanthomonas dyei]WOB52371.1 hypothetical protein NYR95_13135 [Xanthomonas dyei]
MADPIPALPPGFVLEPAAAPQMPAQAAPPLPAGFVLDGDIPTLPAVQAQRPDFSNVQAGVDSTAQTSAGDGWEPGVLRDVALGGRAVLQGAGSLFGALGGDAINTAVINPVARAIGAQEAQPYRDELGGLADLLGLPTAQSAGERINADISEALTGTALTMGVGSALNTGRTALTSPSVRTKLADVLTSQPVMQAISTVTGAGAGATAREAGAGTGGQVLAALGGALGPVGLMSGGAAALRGAFRGGEAGRQALTQAIGDFSAVGATPSVGQGTGSWARQGTESLLAGGPTSGGVMRRFAEQQNEQIGEGLNDVSNQLARNISGEKAGRAIERGVDTFAKNVGAMRKALYWQADQLIPGDTAIPLGNTQRALTELTTPVVGAEATTGAMISPKIQQLAQNVADDLATAQATGAAGIPYEAVKQIRSKIGEELSDFSLSTDRPTAQLKQLYASLSDDMLNAARAAGPAAERAVQRANTYFRASADRLENLERVVDKNGGPEKIYQAALSGTRDGATTLRAVMRSLPEDAQKALSAAVIKRMGLANPSGQNAVGDAISPNTLLTNWGKLSPEARRELFGRFGPTFSSNMDKIARVAGRIKEGSEVFKNPSGTANRAAALAYPATIGGLLVTGQTGSAAAAALGGVGANSLARLMTNPRFVSWLARATETPVGALPAQINVLKRMAVENEDDDVAQVADALSASEGRAQQPQQ